MPSGIYDRTNIKPTYGMLGKHQSEEAKKKISEFNKGKKISIETRLRIGKANKGHLHSLETKNKIREKRKLQIIAPESRSKSGDKLRGRKRSPETCRKISESLFGKKLSQEHRLSLKLNHKGMLGKKASLETRKIMSVSQSGDKNHFWKGGITPFRLSIRMSFEYRLWRSDVYKRDNYTCQSCWARSGGGKTVILEAHHIKRFSKIMDENNINTMEQARLCAELWDINNGLTLCDKCHASTKEGRPL